MTEKRRLATVIDAFVNTGRGLALNIGLPEVDDWQIANGQSIVIKRPADTDLTAVIVSIESIYPSGSVALVLGHDVKLQDVHVGTEIWINA